MGEKEKPESDVRDQVFISYSHKDKNWLEKLQKTLAPLVKKELKVWDDSKIKPGQKFKIEIEKALKMAKVAVLLVSSDFLASPFINKEELAYFFEAAEKEGLKILWVAIRHSMVKETWIFDYQAVNNPEKPLAGLPIATQEAELVKICEKIKEAMYN